MTRRLDSRSFRFVCLLTASLLFVTSFGVGVAAAQTPDVPEVATNRDRFQIPFDFDASRLAAMGCESVELYVARDGGRWELAETTTPDQRAFLYQASGEGEYVFCVRAKNADGSRIPDKPLAPSLKVSIDQTEPTAEFQTFPTIDGSTSVEWTINEAHLALDTVAIETRLAGEPWTPVSIRADATGAVTVSADVGEEVRLIAEDKAGNRLELTKSLPITKARIQPASQTQLASANAPSALTAPVLDNDVQANAPVTLESATVDSPKLDAPEEPAGESLAAAMGIVPATIPKRAPVAPTTPQQTAALDLPTDPVNVATSDAAEEVWKTGITRRVNAHTFRLGYQLEDVGPSGLSTVSLYITEDYGQSWFHYGNDPDATNPMDVTVPRDGVFGFAFRVTSGVGLGDLPPQPGERPDITVAVDSTAPSIQMYPLTHDQGGRHHKIHVRWAAYDVSLPARPIRIEYGSSPSGPWTPVAPPQANTGLYEWDVTQPMPGAVYLRVTVTDAAGNMSSDFTREPLMLDFSRPAARITTVEPVIQR